MDIDRFINYASEYDPSFRSRILGVTLEQLQKFESLVGKTLPRQYTTFLSRLGQKDGDLRIGDDSSTDIDDLIEYYQDIRNDGTIDAMLPSDCIVIAYIGV